MADRIGAAMRRRPLVSRNTGGVFLRFRAPGAATFALNDPRAWILYSSPAPSSNTQLSWRAPSPCLPVSPVSIISGADPSHVAPKSRPVGDVETFLLPDPERARRQIAGRPVHPTSETIYRAGFWDHFPRRGHKGAGGPRISLPRRMISASWARRTMGPPGEVGD